MDIAKNYSNGTITDEVSNILEYLNKYIIILKVCISLFVFFCLSCFGDCMKSKDGGSRKPGRNIFAEKADTFWLKSGFNSGSKRNG